MRSHRQFPALDLWNDGNDLRALVHVDNVAIARIEPIMHRRLGAAVLDIAFLREERYLIVPAIRIDTGMLLEREDSPFIWPASISDVLPDARTEAIEEFLLPFLWSRSRARSLNLETYRVFNEAAGNDFEAARAANIIGAAPYHAVAKSLAPYWYAARFSAGKRGFIGGPGAPLGWRLLRKSARSVDLAPGGDERIRRWLDAPLAAQGASDVYDFAVVDTASREALGDRLGAIPDVVALDESEEHSVGLAWPVPTDLLVSFDLAEAPAAVRFSVRSQEAPLRDEMPAANHTAAGGSGGNIYFALRSDYRIAPDADVDSARALAGLLVAEGFTVDVGGPLPPAGASRYDLVHAFGLTDIEALEETLAVADQYGVPVVLSADFEDFADRRWWGAKIGPVAYHSRDEIELQLRLEKMVRRELETDSYSPLRRCAEPANFDERARAALGRVRAVYVADDSDGNALRDLFGYTGEAIVVGPFIASAAQPESVAWQSGSGDFVFAHAPIVERTNAIALARAAHQQRLPLVIAGPVADVHLLERVREYGDERLVLLPEATPGELTRLYRTARVYVEVPWYQYSAARAVRALLCGASLVVSSLGISGRMLADAARRADPASEREIGSRLREAWVSGPPPRSSVQQFLSLVNTPANLRAVVSGYARTAAEPAGR